MTMSTVSATLAPLTQVFARTVRRQVKIYTAVRVQRRASSFRTRAFELLLAIRAQHLQSGRQADRAWPLGLSLELLAQSCGEVLGYAVGNTAVDWRDGERLARLGELTVYSGVELVCNGVGVIVYVVQPVSA